MGGSAAIGRDGGQDTHGAWQGSYQVTSARPVGAPLDTARPSRQINAKAPAPSVAKGRVVSTSQTQPDSIESGILD
jgi:hypothetical protein